MPPKRRPTKSRRRIVKKRPVRALPEARVLTAVATMAAPTGTARFAAGKALCATAAKDPKRVCSHFDAVAAMLESDSKIVCWNAMRLLAMMAAADSGHRLDAVLDRYLAFIDGDNLISAANAIQGTAHIGRARPDLLDRIVPAVLGVERARYATPECRNVAIGEALNAFAQLGDDVCRRPDVARFIRRQRTNPRSAVARRAERMTAMLAE